MKTITELFNDWQWAELEYESVYNSNASLDLLDKSIKTAEKRYKKLVREMEKAGYVDVHNKIKKMVK